MENSKIKHVQPAARLFAKSFQAIRDDPKRRLEQLQVEQSEYTREMTKEIQNEIDSFLKYYHPKDIGILVANEEQWRMFKSSFTTYKITTMEQFQPKEMKILLFPIPETGATTYTEDIKWIQKALKLPKERLIVIGLHEMMVKIVAWNSLSRDGLNYRIVNVSKEEKAKILYNWNVECIRRRHEKTSGVSPFRRDLIIRFLEHYANLKKTKSNSCSGSVELESESGDSSAS